VSERASDRIGGGGGKGVEQGGVDRLRSWRGGESDRQLGMAESEGEREVAGRTSDVER
jgi:hypothetical protein